MRRFKKFCFWFAVVAVLLMTPLYVVSDNLNVDFGTSYPEHALVDEGEEYSRRHEAAVNMLWFGFGFSLFTAVFMRGICCSLNREFDTEGLGFKQKMYNFVATAGLFFLLPWLFFLPGVLATFSAWWALVVLAAYFIALSIIDELLKKAEETERQKIFENILISSPVPYKEHINRGTWTVSLGKGAVAVEKTDD